MRRRKQRIASLVDFYNDLPVSKDSNTVISAHNGVVHCDMFENYCDNPSLEEGGFYVISRRPDGLYLEHEFHNYNRFNKVFLRPLKLDLSYKPIYNLIYLVTR